MPYLPSLLEMRRQRKGFGLPLPKTGTVPPLSSQLRGTGSNPRGSASIVSRLGDVGGDILGATRLPLSSEQARPDLGAVTDAGESIAALLGRVERTSGGLYPFGGGVASKGGRLFNEAAKKAARQRPPHPYVDERDVQFDRYENVLNGKLPKFGTGIIKRSPGKLKGKIPERLPGQTQGDFHWQTFAGTKLNPKQLPKTLFHTTVGARNIAKTGRILGKGHGQTGLGGLGGGAHHGSISLTPSRADALHTTRELKYLVGLAKQHGKKLDELRLPDDPNAYRPPMSDAFRAEAGVVRKKLIDRAKGEGWDFKPNSPHAADSVKGMWQDYAHKRLSATSSHIGDPRGIKDPWFLTDDAKLMKIHPDDIAMLKVPSRWLNPRGLITKSRDTSGQEIRTYADIHLRNTRHLR
jgi:hypothetical protein